MLYTDEQELIKAIAEYRTVYGTGDIRLDKLEDLIRKMRKKK